MSIWPIYPMVCEINAWVWLNDLGSKAGRRMTLGEIPEKELDRLASLGLDAVWLMGVWERSPRGREIARMHPDLQAEYYKALPDLKTEDIVGSPYSIHDYRVDPALGGDHELAALRRRLRERNLLLLLDFLPNHLAVDHPWLLEHPERFLSATPAHLATSPGNYFVEETKTGRQVFAYGRDPYFPAWTDTVQLDLRRPGTRRALIDTLLGIAGKCDGVRCDMAMLVTHDVFLRTWGGEFDPPGTEFWCEAIPAVRKAAPDFLMVAEVYWNMEYTMQQQGFDFTYDKHLYDLLVKGEAGAVRAHLGADMGFQRKLARFIENHDERRAMDAFGPERTPSAALLALALPGMRLLHQGQTEGRRLKLPVQLGRSCPEPPEPGMVSFYLQLLSALRAPVFREGTWKLLDPHAAWPGNPSHNSFVAYSWKLGEERRLITANLSGGNAQCYLFPADLDLGGRTWVLQDLLSDACYTRDGNELLTRGLYLDMPAWGCHLFDLQMQSTAD